MLYSYVGVCEFWFKTFVFCSFKLYVDFQVGFPFLIAISQRNRTLGVKNRKKELFSSWLLRDSAYFLSFLVFWLLKYFYRDRRRFWRIGRASNTGKKVRETMPLDVSFQLWVGFSYFNKKKNRERENGKSEWVWILATLFV